MKNNKGFTLIELMIAIAIIGILALVLIPRVAGLKNSARAAGLDSTIRVGMSVAEGVLDNYPATAVGCQNLETYLTTKLVENKAENPFTKATTCDTETNVIAAATAGTVAFSYANDGATENNPETFASNAKYEGVVLFDAYVDAATNTIKVEFQGCDASGNLVGTAKVTN